MNPVKFLSEIEKERIKKKCSIYILVDKIVDNFDKNCKESITKMKTEITLAKLTYEEYKQYRFNNIEEFYSVIKSILETRATPINDYEISCIRVGTKVTVKAKIKDLGNVYKELKKF